MLDENLLRILKYILNNLMILLIIMVVQKEQNQSTLFPTVTDFELFLDY